MKRVNEFPKQEFYQLFLRYSQEDMTFQVKNIAEKYVLEFSILKL